MTNNKLDPNWVTGFTDAEGCFMIDFTKSKTNKMKWQIKPCFQILLHNRDKELLMKIKSFFNEIGSITYSNDNGVRYRIYKLDDIINIIIPHFDKYSLITQKKSDFLLFKEIIKIMDNKEHLNKDGLIKIVNLKSSLNKGLSDILKINFPNTIKKERSKVNIPININYNWIAGFMSGDGCFYIRVYKSNTHKTGHGISLQIIFSQHEVLFDMIKKVLGCGYIYKRSERNIIDLRIYNFEDIYYKIIPMFNKHKIIGVKSLDFQNFCLAAELVNKKAHLTKDRLEEIRKIKSRMNRHDLYKTVK